MAGLLSTNINKDNPLSSVVGYDAEKIALDNDTDTVEGRVNRLIAKDSPLNQRAATRARQAANQGGLLNSSMAVGAAQQAVLDSAMPIAQQDAQTSYAAKAANQSAGNQALATTAQNQTQGALQQLSGEQRLEQIGSEADAQSRLQAEQGQINTGLQELSGQQNLDQIKASSDEQLRQQEFQQQFQTLQAQLDRDQQTAMAKLENEYGNMRQSSESASIAFSATMEAINNILIDPEITAFNKQTIINQQLDLLGANMNMLSTALNVDVGGLFAGGNLSSFDIKGRHISGADWDGESWPPPGGYTEQAPNGQVRRWVAISGGGKTVGHWENVNVTSDVNTYGQTVQSGNY